ncbi:aldose 1-epimerase [Bifidobacterium gallicum DSM 20093 = LMG 11596]|uniref:Aldose 1-epimerase n=1 Tax=Bifidobacterium gallicum DSM 20093 = LMG 11596 TaxID=561180 RepID=D1NSY8_9BIFI|nr:aldose 1-epimerase [Bifidobacterium gallicum DSM 20093 = LMG 11596]
MVTQLGATLRALTYQGEDVIESTGADDIVSCCQGQLLVPFPNRIANATYEFDGCEYVLPIDEHERHTAIHGYGYRAFWTLIDLREDEVTLQWRVPNMEGYPFDLVVNTTYRLDDDGIHIRVCATNHGQNTAPWALGIHPWISNGKHHYGDAIDADNAACTLQIPAASHVCVDNNLIPTGVESVDGTKFDFREGLALTQQPYDDALTDVAHDESGWTSALFTRPDGMVVRVAGDETITSFQVCTGTGFPPPKHPAGVAIEPQTAYANAFNTKRDLIAIEAGQTSETNMLISVVHGLD